jgi:uncharacterized DUF497 family protein
MPLRFSWDPQKAESNWAKHGATFEEAVSVFADPLACIFDDAAHSEGEQRELIVGNSKLRRLILVSFVETKEKVRIISARKVTRAERKDYEENIDS